MTQVRILVTAWLDSDKSTMRLQEKANVYMAAPPILCRDRIPSKYSTTPLAQRIEEGEEKITLMGREVQNVLQWRNFKNLCCPV